jgi:hypothetical protein
VVLFGRCRVVEGGGSAQRRLNQGEGMGKNKGRARRTLREEEREGGGGAGATRGGGAPDGRHGAGAAEVGVGRPTCEQGRRGWRGPGRWAVMGPLAWAGLNE